MTDNVNSCFPVTSKQPDTRTNGSVEWNASGTPELRPGEVRVWYADLDQPEPVVRSLNETIDSEERQRAMRFRFQHDRRRFIVARAVLRTILALHLGIKPQEIVFRYNLYGKPFLAGGLEKSRLQFNVSHSANGALYAVAQGRRVGIDLEFIRPLIDMRNLAQSCFSTSENAAFRALPEQDRPRSFFDGWTRKEAFLKATGRGLSLSTKSFEVSLAPGAGLRELKVSENAENRAEWLLISLMPRANCSAALVVEGRDCSVRIADLSISADQSYRKILGETVGCLKYKSS